MRLQLYTEIKCHIEGSHCSLSNDVKALYHLFPGIDHDTLCSIYSLIWQRKIKNDYCHHHSKDRVHFYYKTYRNAVINREDEGFLCRISEEHQIPPTSLARIVLEEWHKSRFKRTKVIKGVVSKYLKYTDLIDDPILSRETLLCVKSDRHCGPKIEQIKKEMGLKYEKRLHETLVEKRIPYYDESILRKQGYDKTPDFKLVSPIAVNGHVVNWIESKASFGDEESHSVYLKDQFWSYTNRFGPGMVIYWFGFIDELNINIERGILLECSFPDNFLTIDGILDEDICRLKEITYPNKEKDSLLL